MINLNEKFNFFNTKRSSSSQTFVVRKEDFLKCTVPLKCFPLKENITAHLLENCLPPHQSESTREVFVMVISSTLQ